MVYLLFRSTIRRIATTATMPITGTSVKTAAGAPAQVVVFVMSTIAPGRIAAATISAMESPMIACILTAARVFRNKDFVFSNILFHCVSSGSGRNLKRFVHCYVAKP